MPHKANSSVWDKIRRFLRRWEPLYWLRTHTIHRYHIINISGQGDYSWGWIDRSHAMYLACFKLLEEFVEQEDPEIGTRIEADYRGDPSVIPEDEWVKYHKPSIDQQLEKDREVRALYDWWKTGRKQEHEACDKILDGYDRSFNQMFKPAADKPGYLEYVPDPDPRWEAWKIEYDRLEAKDEEMLQRLMKVRQSLWT